MEIRDPIHGNILLDETEAKIVDTPEMQRLRYIKQLDTTHLVFPGASHSRFEHSLGSMHVTKELTASLYKGEKKEFSYVGLLHDIGHGPFSHLSEKLISGRLNKNHEKIGEEIIRNSEIKDIITDSGLSFEKVMSYFKDAENIDIVGGPLGSDRIDYLMRDSYYTGVAYGIIDYERIKSRMVLYKDKVAILESGISGVESLLISRYFMYNNVYFHHAKTISNEMLVRALELALDGKELDAEELSRMYDEQMIYRLSNSKLSAVNRLVGRYKNRDLFKRAYNHKIKEPIDRKKLEEEITNAGFDKSDFITNVGSFGGSKDDFDVVDSDNNYLGKASDISPFVKTLTGVLTTSKKLLVACDKKNAEQIGKITRQFVGDLPL